MPNNLPNLLTLSRIAVIPPIVAAFYVGGAVGIWTAFGLYALACVTDFFDGHLARIQNLTSSFGRFLDPVADKLLVGALLVLLPAFDHVNGWTVLPAIVIMLREILVSGLREYLAEIRVGMPVSKLAKWKTTIQMLAIGFLIVGDFGPEFLATRLIGEVGLWIAAGLTLVTGVDYLVIGLSHMDTTPDPLPDGEKADA
jgi:cardiolipin synthase